MTKGIKVLGLMLCCSVLLVAGCKTVNLTGSAPSWMRKPLPQRDDVIDAIGIASNSIIPEVARQRAKVALYTEIAKRIEIHVTTRVKDLVEDHAVFEDAGLSHSHILYQRVTDQITKRCLRKPFVSEVWVDTKGRYGEAGMVYAYGWIKKAESVSMGLRNVADVLRERKVRLKLSEAAERDLNLLIEEMYEKADEIEREAAEKNDEGMQEIEKVSDELLESVSKKGN